MIMGTEVLLLGGTDSGSRALSKDKSANLYLAVNAALGDLAEAVDRDLIDVLWMFNNFPPEMKPSARVEDVTFRQIEEEAAIIRDLAGAGAILDVEDPIIDWFRAKIGAPPMPEIRTDTGLDNPDEPGGNGGADAEDNVEDDEE